MSPVEEDRGGGRTYFRFKQFRVLEGRVSSAPFPSYDPFAIIAMCRRKNRLTLLYREKKESFRL